MDAAKIAKSAAESAMASYANAKLLLAAKKWKHFSVIKKIENLVSCEAAMHAASVAWHAARNYQEKCAEKMKTVARQP